MAYKRLEKDEKKGRLIEKYKDIIQAGSLAVSLTTGDVVGGTGREKQMSKAV